MSHTPILQPGTNCWRIASADRATPLIDAESYFGALHDALEQAEHTIYILGWDIDSRVPLRPNHPDPSGSESLSGFLNNLLGRKKNLHCYVLVWDFAMVYAFQREWMPIYKMGWKTHRHLHFHMDDRHPIGASHHQKVVVIDDRVAFVGGLDITKQRWDRRAHDPDDPRRVDPDGVRYSPFHDAQMAVEGEVARALGELARTRWERATGHKPLAPPDPSASAWPTTLAAAFHNTQVAIARTVPIYDGQPEVREVERLFIDSIRAARRFVYIENQYFTSSVVARAILDRLQEQDGPEFVVVSPLRTHGWLAEHTMDILRARWLRTIRAADRFDRFRAFYPDIEGLGKDSVNVHAKVMVVDDRLLRIGSANLNNRSMGLDTECDLAIEAEGHDDALRETIRSIRDDLVAEHVGCAPTEVASALQRENSLIRAIESLHSERRCLRTIPDDLPPEVDALIPEGDLIDPERPIDPDVLVDDMLAPEDEPHTRRRVIAFVLALAALLSLAAAWRWTPLNQWADPAALVALAEPLRDSLYGPFLAIASFVVGGVLVLPVTVLIAATILIFGTFAGLTYALIGTLASAAATYALGRMMRRGTIRRLIGGKLNRLSKRLAKRGLLAIIIVRVVPVAPFSVVNLVAGASHIRFKDFFIGTFIGMFPGMVAIALFIDRLQAAIFKPDAAALALLAAAVLVIVVASLGVRRWIKRKDAPRPPGTPEQMES